MYIRLIFCSSDGINMLQLINIFLLAQLMSSKLNLSLCDTLLSGIQLSFRASVRNLQCHRSGHLELDSPYLVHRPMGDWLSPIIELGHTNLLCGFYRTKFPFLMYFKGIYFVDFTQDFIGQSSLFNGRGKNMPIM